MKNEIYRLPKLKLWIPKFGGNLLISKAKALDSKTTYFTISKALESKPFELIWVSY